MTDESVFATALAIPSPAERAAYLDRACADNPTLRREVEELLAAHAADNPLDHRPADLARTGAYEPGDAGPAPASVGDRVGPYRLMEQIGEGGFGLVFVAEQTEPVRRKVALKVLKPGMDTRDVVARFEAERQALALMDHPNIAKVLDAGSTDAGRPYFVMELVRGVPVTEFCDRHKLPPRDRLELFVRVCQAVQHAHQKGVIHRDLKPSNVLVTSHDGVPVPKVIDFGVAKAVGQTLTEKTIYTRFAQMIGTPLYMSPEQAEMSGLDLDTRSDVYALGVLLYELLTGTTPFDRDRFRKAAFDEIRRIIREEEPPRPSTRLTTSGATLTAVSANRRTDPGKLAGLVKGELDWIVMRCLEKDRNRRYDTANGLAKDVQRHLDGLAVEACPPTLGYRLRKAYRRNRAAVLTAGVFALVLLAAAAVSLAFAVHAGRLKEMAESAERDAARDRDAAVSAGWEAAHNRDAAIAASKEIIRQRDETDDALRKLKFAQDEQQANQYVWDMQTVPLAFEAGNIAEVNRLLDRHVPQPGRPDRRGFEWYYWDRQLHSDLRTDSLPDVGDSTGMWVASPDGSRVARLAPPEAGRETPVLSVWDVAARKLVLTHRLPPQRPADQFSVAVAFPPRFSPDGRRVVVGWNPTAAGPGGGFGALRPRRVVDVATGKVLLELDGGDARSIRLRSDIDGHFSPDGRRFAAMTAAPAKEGGGRVQARVWDLETGTEVCPPLDADDLAESPFGPDGTRLVTVRFDRSNQGGTRVSVWDLTGGQELAGWNVPEIVLHALAVSPDGQRVAGVTVERQAERKNDLSHIEPRVVKIWEAATGKELHALPMARMAGTGPYGARAFFSPDGSRLVVERRLADARNGAMSSELTLWDPVGGKPLPAGLINSVTRRTSELTFSPDGKYLVDSDGNALRTWDAETGRPLLTLRGHVNLIAAHGFTPDGRGLWSLEWNGRLKEWDARPRQPVAIRLVVDRNLPRGAVFAVSPDGGRVAALVEVLKGQPGGLNVPSGSFDVHVWDGAGKKVQTLVPPPRDPAPGDRANPSLALYDLALSGDGRRAVLTRADFVRPGADPADVRPPDVTVWDVESGGVLLHEELEGRHRPNPAISADGRLLAVATRPTGEGAAHAVRVYDLDARPPRPPRVLPLPGTRAVAGASFSPDGRRVAVLALKGDGIPSSTLFVWDLERASPLSAVEPESRATIPSGEFGSRFAWSPDGARFAFPRGVRNTAAVAVHDAATGNTLVTLEQPIAEDTAATFNPSLAFSPDGKRVAAFLPPRTFRGSRAVKVWDAASGKELLTLRPPTEGLSPWSKRLMFSRDGHRLVFAELVDDPERPAGRPQSVTQSLLLTTWDATPVAGREPAKP